MGELINGRTPEEIKAAVLCTEKGTIPDCLNCPYYGELDENGFRAYQCHQAGFDLIAYAELLEAERDAALAKVPKWISVEERLPENGNDVLCWYEYYRYGDYNRMYQTYGIGCCWNGTWCGDVSSGSRTKVLYWMPLPERPKESK